MSKQRTVAEDIASLRDKLAQIEKTVDNNEQTNEAWGLENTPKVATKLPGWLEKASELFGKTKPAAVVPPKVAPAGVVHTARPNNPNIAGEVVPSSFKPGVLSPEEAAKALADHGEVGLAAAQRRAADEAAALAAKNTANTNALSAAMKPAAGATDSVAKTSVSGANQGAQAGASSADDAAKAAALKAATKEMEIAHAGGKASFLKWVKANPGKVSLVALAAGLPAGYFLSGAGSDDGQGAQSPEAGAGAGASGADSQSSEDLALIAEITALYKELSASGVADIVTALVPIKDKFEKAGGKFATDAGSNASNATADTTGGPNMGQVNRSGKLSAEEITASGGNLGVAQMQDELVAKDPGALPVHGVDGKMGPETRRALAKNPEVAARYGFK